jgi:hypothetical protein
MKVRLILGLALLVMAGPAFAQKTFIDYDKGYDFDSVKTFAWAPTSETSVEASNPLLHSRIVNGIEYYLSHGGLQEVKSDPDVYVTYHTSSKEEMSLNTTSFGYGYPGGMAWGGYGGYYGGWGGYGMGMGSSTTNVYSYEIGTLVVDVWDPKTEKLVWRGTATGITVVDNPQKMQNKIDKALKKIVAKSQKAMADK